MFRHLLFCLWMGLILGIPRFASAVEEEAPGEQLVTHLSTLGQAPDWTQLEQYQGTISHDDFVHLLNDIYCTHGISSELIEVNADTARILKTTGTRDYFILHFAPNERKSVPRGQGWKRADTLPPASETAPLTGLHIALDPGHLGGTWAKMEERWFQMDKKPPIAEGDMTLRVAQMLAPRLQSLGAEVSLVRSNNEPLTPNRPSDFREMALELLHKAGVSQPREKSNGAADPLKEQTIQWQEELLFYRNSEIRRRAYLVNYQLRPDLVLCLHFNAEPWGDPSNPQLVDKNHLHLLVNGSYLASEAELDDERFEMLHKLLSRAFSEELDMAEACAMSLAGETGLPSYQYKTENVKAVGKSGYVYARNLLATRLYRCPTVYFEPYVMNSNEVFERIEAGDYSGLRHILGKKRPSIYREYVDGVVAGLVSYFKKVRPRL